MASTILSNAALFLSTLAPVTIEAFWRIYANTMVTARVGPLISPGGHVHDYAGGNNFGINYDYNDQIGSSCTSSEIQADESGYWAPAVYYKGRDGSCRALMSALKNTLNPGNEADEAINFHCLGPDTETLQFPDQYCPGGVRGFLPAGMAMMSLVTTFTIMSRIQRRQQLWRRLVLWLSRGDNVGWSSQADFAMGWDINLLQQAIDECTDDRANLAVCSVLMQFDNGPLAGQCKPAKYLPLEDVDILLLLVQIGAGYVGKSPLIP